MKQTNNAIKFLMAQYRAIFKHANIAMVTAMAAAALAAGQAQANPKNFDNAALNGIVETDATIDGTGTEAKKYLKIELSDGAKSEKAFNITVAGGGAANVIKGGVDFSNSAITVAGADKAQAKLNIGLGAAKATSVKLKSLAVANQGELAITGASDKKTSVTAETLSFGNGKDAAN